MSRAFGIRGVFQPEETTATDEKHLTSPLPATRARLHAPRPCFVRRAARLSAGEGHGARTGAPAVLWYCLEYCLLVALTDRRRFQSPPPRVHFSLLLLTTPPPPLSLLFIPLSSSLLLQPSRQDILAASTSSSSSSESLSSRGGAAAVLPNASTGTSAGTRTSEAEEPPRAYDGAAADGMPESVSMPESANDEPPPRKGEGRGGEGGGGGGGGEIAGGATADASRSCESEDWGNTGGELL